MSRALVLSQGLDGWVRLEVRGCLLKLRQADYYAALDAGKAERRALAQAAREHARQAREEAARLAWIEEETL